MAEIQVVTDIADIIEQAIKKCVDIFVADYRAVNPKPSQ